MRIRRTFFTYGCLLCFVLSSLSLAAESPTDEPESNRVIAWAKTYKGARVVYIQSGHDHFAYENPSCQQVLRQAIRWTAHKN